MKNEKIISCLKEIDNKIVDLINKLSSPSQKTNDNLNCDNASKFKHFVIDSENLSSKTADRYITYLKMAKKKFFKQLGIQITKEIYEIVSLNEIIAIKTKLWSSPYFKFENSRRHNIFSASLNCYIKYLKTLEK